jgi:hypothetical protein
MHPLDVVLSAPKLSLCRKREASKGAVDLANKKKTSILIRNAPSDILAEFDPAEVSDFMRAGHFG